ncbi:hypothetical protein JTE90_003626 [Oedothorax gibbosus]|uniref:C2H2-type domain-containing protein n=1 Tax=Oedothorax gibbosus TaxID=931172 RepID=A0AAV6U0A2_9ARAC|nr:hypothetical protein JTE90_003626 [Oedothorax gibbosus]
MIPWMLDKEFHVKCARTTPRTMNFKNKHKPFVPLGKRPIIPAYRYQPIQLENLPLQKDPVPSSISQDIFSKCLEEDGKGTDLFSSDMINLFNIQSFPCSGCSKVFYRKDVLKVHERTHTGQKIYKCPHCQYTASQVGHLKAHVSCKHSQSALVCDVCGKGFAYASHLKKHRILKHNGI